MSKQLVFKICQAAVFVSQKCEMPCTNTGLLERGIQWVWWRLEDNEGETIPTGEIVALRSYSQQPSILNGLLHFNGCYLVLDVCMWQCCGVRSSQRTETHLLMKECWYSKFCKDQVSRLLSWLFPVSEKGQNLHFGFLTQQT